MPESLARLAALSAFAGADPAALAEAAQRARWISLGPGEIAVDFGDPSTDVFVVSEGTVRVVVRLPTGHEVILDELGPGAVFGEMAAIDGAPRSASVTALHATRLCRLPADAFLGLVLRSPPVGLRLLRVLVGRLRLLDRRLLEVTVLPVRLRLCAELLRLSRPRGTGGERVVSPPPPQHILAARIGARREAVSRDLGALAREGLVEIGPRAIVLLRPATMEAMVDAELRDADAAEAAQG